VYPKAEQGLEHVNIRKSKSSETDFRLDLPPLRKMNKIEFKIKENTKPQVPIRITSFH
jgi:hypothetical protein